MKHTHQALHAILALSIFMAPAVHAGELLDKIKSSQQLTIGYRADYPPFTYTLPDGALTGYSIESCSRIASIMGKNLGIPLKLQYVPVTNSDRMDAVRSGRVDLECADTTNTSQRRQQFGVAYLSPYFVTGARILANQQSGIRHVHDLKGKTLAYTANTTSEEISKKYASIWGVHIRPCGPAVATCFKELESGKIDAWMFDDIALQSSRATSAHPEHFHAVGNLLSVEHLAPMYKAGDDELAQQLDAAMRQFMTSGEARKLYRRWFEQTIPSRNINLQIAPSSLLLKYMQRPSPDIGEYTVY